MRSLPLLLMALVASTARAADVKPATAPADKPRIAFFPIAGNSKEELRKRTWDSLRLKLDRTDTYEVIDGPKMLDTVEELKAPVGFETEPAAVKELNSTLDAQVLVWGEMNNTPQGATVRVHVLDLRKPDAPPQTVEGVIRQPTDLRFVSEHILQALPGVKEFEHPSEEPVSNDAESAALWEKNPNLVSNGDFSDNGAWQAIYQAEKYPVKVSEELPAVDKVNIFKMPGENGGKLNNVLAMNLSRTCAENNGMACLSNAIQIKPDTRYRISFRYKSDGPTLHVFVKGYTTGLDIKGQPAEREIYRRQVPPSGNTHGQWVTVVDDLNPQHVAFPVQTLRVDLYAYLSPGTVMFDDVVLKAVGKQTRSAHDDAIKPPVTAPTH